MNKSILDVVHEGAIDLHQAGVMKDVTLREFKQYATRTQQEERIHNDTKQALLEIETGDFVDGEKVLDWIENWGTKD